MRETITRATKQLFARRVHGQRSTPAPPLPRNAGYCVICEKNTTFVEHYSWLRDHYRCVTCESIPRNRALVNALNRFAPRWRDLQMHESSPEGVLSRFLKDSCRGYTSSHYFADVPRGADRFGQRSEDLSRLTFPDGSFDLFVTSDVFEHVLEPAKAFKEIARVLKPGGMHVFTMPWYPANARTIRRAEVSADGTLVHLMEPIYHCNPLDAQGSLVAFDWGLDFPGFIRQASSLDTIVYLEADRQKGLDGEFLEVFISIKP